jgi:hypothetical protein
MVASDEVQEVVKGLQKLNVEEKSQLFTLVPSLSTTARLMEINYLFR